jgi:serine O-acetyltransferase
VVGVPGRVVVQDGVRVQSDLDQVNLPDPVQEMFREMQKEILELKQEIKELKKRSIIEDSPQGGTENESQALQHFD